MVGSAVRTRRARRLITLLAGNSSATGRRARRLTVLGLVGMLLAVALASQTAAVDATRAGAADRPPYLADPADGGRVKVGIVGGDTTLAARLIARRKLTAVTDLVAVRHGYAELQRAAAWLTAGAARVNPPARNGLVKGLAVWRLPDKNAVELDVPRGQRLTTAQQAMVAAARRRLGSRLVLGTWAGQMRDLACVWSFNGASGKTVFNCDPPLRGGLMLYIRSGASYVPQCTVGFNAKSTVDGKWYVMTAGHCGSPGQTFYVWQPRTRQYHVLGHMHNCVFGGDPNCVFASDDDEGIISIDNVPGWNPKPWVYVHAWTGPNDRTTKNPGYLIAGTGGSRQGLRVCVSGAISGTSCGHVERLGGGSLAQVDLCGEPGDSGAPIFSGQKAYGLLKGANRPDPKTRPWVAARTGSTRASPRQPRGCASPSPSPSLR